MSSPKTAPHEPDPAGNYPAAWVEQVTLPDGLELVVRPIRPEDARGLQAGFRRLSAQSIYLRFLGTIKGLTDEQARQFASLDYITRMAFVACRVEEGKEFLIGVARYGRIDPGEPSRVECAVVVGDAYQGRGIGLLLLDRLIRYGRENGVTEILATIHSANDRIQRFIQLSGFAMEKKMIEPGVWEIRMFI